jgi:hypothetical protein
MITNNSYQSKSKLCEFQADFLNELVFGSGSPIMLSELYKSNCIN